ncbi:hypothetical protein [Nostoc sp. FACHB-133]|uniref:hypothetical protein n=1 Tax=Nostoc sp. FACHB-133 TaxID=2692835 RepID=UPI0016885E29|nr:hypothetical protein [Nostoc sp. FACHB-133]MBD2523195.1 hypothetical protein [Nostoc sp. FACHB-133]
MFALFKGSTFQDFLNTVRSRPGFYLGRKSLTALQALLLGYKQAVIEHNIPEVEQLNCELEDKFDEWLRKNYHMGNAINWYLFIIDQTESEVVAFNRLFELWDEFRK